MRKTICLLCLTILAAGPAFADSLRLAVVTALDASGLSEVLAAEFRQDTGLEVQVIPGNPGVVIQNVMSGEADAALMADPARQEKLVSKGFAVRRHEVMSGDFLIVGPPGDPAGAGSTDTVACLRAIAASGTFISRGDDSATHKREQDLWRAAGLPLREEDVLLVERGERLAFRSVRPENMTAFLAIGGGMGMALDTAEEKGGYTLTDRVTYVRYKYGRPQGLRLETVCEGDRRLVESYGLVLVNPEKQPHTRLDLAEAFARWLVSGRGQRVIADYRLYGRPLFSPDSKMARRADGSAAGS